MGPVVDADWLSQHLGDPDLRVIDFRWYLAGDRTGRGDYDDGHIPGAVFVDLEEVTAATGAGRHPLPSREQFQRVMREAGVGTASRVVVYDQRKGYSAARLWWLLRYFGHPEVAVLDGGAGAWPGPWETEAVRPAEGDFLAAEPDGRAVVGYEKARELLGRRVFLDARAPERFSGEAEPIDAKAGHIPGALNAFYGENLDSDGRLLPAAELRDRYEELGVRSGEDVVMYCGSGVSACLDLLAMELAGLPGARLYAGSWSDWSGHDEAPVATGAES